VRISTACQDEIAQPKGGRRLRAPFSIRDHGRSKDSGWTSRVSGPDLKFAAVQRCVGYQRGTRRSAAAALPLLGGTRTAGPSISGLGPLWVVHKSFGQRHLRRASGFAFPRSDSSSQ
jgi:hypothetical protein